MTPLPSFADQVIGVQDPGKRLVYQSEVDDWDNPGPVRNYEGCWAEPASTVENNENGSTVRSGWDVLMPAGADVNPNSKVWLPNGLDYQVVGEPGESPSATGNLDHVAFHVERWTA